MDADISNVRSVTPFNVSALDAHVVAGPVVYESG